MIFPITELLDETASERGIVRYFHSLRFSCLQGKTGIARAQVCRHSKRGVSDYRCKVCERVYNLYTSTVFAGCQLSASRVVLLLHGVRQGESSASLAAELDVCRSTVPLLRQTVQTNG